MTGFELTVAVEGDEPARDRPAGAEPCESCGTVIQVVDVLGMVRLLAGLDEGEPGGEWMEQRTTVSRDGPRSEVVTQMRPRSGASWSGPVTRSVDGP